MRTKDEILKQDKHEVEIGVRERINFGSRDLLILEVLIDVRDILEMRLREINSDIYKIAQKE